MIAYKRYCSLAKWARRAEKLALLLLDSRLRALYRQGVEPHEVMAYAAPWLHQQRYRTVIDLGANMGQFALAVAANHPSARLICVEPIPTQAATLREALASLDAEVHEVAVGNRNGTTEFFQHAYADSSSTLPMAALHKEAFPFAADVSLQYLVTVRRLDDILAGQRLERPLLLKLDLQGGELAALQGATDVLRNVDLLLIETSLEPLYLGAPLFHEVYTFLVEAGFEMKGLRSSLLDPRSGRPLQMDCFFEPEVVVARRG